MTDEKPTKPIDWKVQEAADKVEHQKLKQAFHEHEKTQNKNRLLYPPDEVGTVKQFNYTNERRS